MSLYQNATQVISLAGYHFNKIVKTNNFICRDNWSSDSNFNDVVFDEFKIFNRPLNSSEIPT